MFDIQPFATSCARHNAKPFNFFSFGFYLFLTIFGYIIHDHSCFIPSMDYIFFHLMNLPMVVMINQSMKIVTKFWAHKKRAFDKSKDS